ncbi:MAG: asparagine synthase (glutamine-hydrolyzing) [Geobacteraceae bacterium]|nr:asparagine synthase (glutamine-hydrolyzing) [Geobacteraceae bacterium]
MGAICGIWNIESNDILNRETLEKMNNTMAHKGQGAIELWYNDCIGMAWKISGGQLKNNNIIYKSGNQSTCGFDGIIYDDKLLNKRNENHILENKECYESKFICQLYLKHGLSFLEKIDGDFSIAIWDADNQQLILARDRFGTRPLYFYCKNGLFLFASEIKAIVSVLKQAPQLNRSVISEYFTFRSICGPQTIYDGIREVLPGYCVTVSRSGIIEDRYWKIEDYILERNIEGIKYYENSLEDLLRKSVIKRAKLSNRVGANCSGGIDSGLVTAFASAVNAESPIETFTVGFNETGWDERYYARLTAQKYRTKHSEIVVSSNEFVDVLPLLNRINDEPLSDPNSVLLYLLGQFSSGRIDLLLTGEGADEALLGYPRYNLLNIYQYIRSLPQSLHEIAKWGSSLLPGRKMKKLQQTLQYEPADAVLLNSSFVASSDLKRILKDDLVDLKYNHRKSIIKSLGNQEDVLRNIMIYDIRTYTAGSLKRLHKMNVSVGLEVVNPFLDKEFFEFVLSIPMKYKISLLDNKIVLRKVAKKYLPKKNMKMPKSGFGVPLVKWLAESSVLNDYFEEMYLDKTMKEMFFLDEVKKCVKMHRQGVSDFSELLWLILNFYIWHRATY